MSRNTDSDPQPDRASYAIRKLKIFFKDIFFSLTPASWGLKNCKKPISKKMKIIIWGCLIAQMKRFDALIGMKKKIPALCKVLFLKNQEKPLKENGPF